MLPGPFAASRNTEVGEQRPRLTVEGALMAGDRDVGEDDASALLQEGKTLGSTRQGDLVCRRYVQLHLQGTAARRLAVEQIASLWVPAGSCGFLLSGAAPQDPNNCLD